MAARVLSGKDFAAQIKAAAKARAAKFEARTGARPGLAVILVGENPASEVYVRNKEKACEELGFYSEKILFPASVSKGDLIAKIRSLNGDAKIHGILLQLPLPDALSSAETEILEMIAPEKDVDGFHPMNVGRLSIGADALAPCTPAGCIEMLKLAGIPMKGKKAVIIGRSNIVGKPMAQLLLQQHATVTICHSRTENLPAVCREADILVAAIGKPEFVTADYIKQGATVLDVGINRIGEKKLVGDVAYAEATEVAGAITPVPGGVGLLTVAMLMDNVVTAAERIHRI